MASSAWAGSAATNTNPGSAQRVAADVVRYVNKVDSDSGWLLVGEDGVSRGEWKSLFKYCKVLLIGAKGGRTYFKILEGVHEGSVAFLSDSNANIYLGRTPPKQEPVELVMTYGRFNPIWKSVSRDRVMPQQMATGEIDGIHFEAAMNTSWGGGFFPIPPGTYKILLPDVPHERDLTAQYKVEYPKLSHHQIWFPISYGNNSRYVHVDNVSEGCVTVVTLRKWSDIQERLVSHRAPDGKSVGTLIVKGKPERAR